MMPFAEVIGDPIAQSKSPLIHKHWLSVLGLEGDYVRTRVAADELDAFLEKRRADPNWRGCNVTIPHKERIVPLLARLNASAQAIGAVNCVVPESARLTGHNTDVDGVGAALDSADIAHQRVAVIGAGGGARAVVAYLAERGAGQIVLVVRNPERAEALRPLARGVEFAVVPFDQADLAFNGVAALVNASPLGMAGAPEMPRAIIDAVTAHAPGITLFDMVTTPADTPLLQAARKAGAAQLVDGLAMLIGQARRAFELFFGCVPPPGDSELREKLGTHQ
jgi:shikimate dehydrogenase